MNVLHTLGMDILGVTGSPIRALEICRNLAKRGSYRLYATSYSHGVGRMDRRFVDGIEVRRVPYRTVPTEELRFTVNFPRYYGLNARMIREKNIDLVHAHFFDAALAACIARKAHGVPYVYDMHGLFPDQSLADAPLMEKLRFLHWIPVERMMRNNAFHIVATSDTMAEYLVRKGFSRVTSVPVGVNTDFFRPSPPDAGVVKRLCLSGKDVVVYTGNVNPYQGLDDMLEAVPAVIKENRNAVFVVVGGGEYLEQTKRKARALGVEKHVIFTGQVPYEQVPSYISAADVTLSLRDASFFGEFSFPTKLTGYMACGKPSICTRTGDQVRILEKWDTGFLVEPGNVKNLAETIVSSLSDKGRLRKLGKKCREVAAGEFSWDVLCERYVKIYNFAGNMNR